MLRLFTHALVLILLSGFHLIASAKPLVDYLQNPDYSDSYWRAAAPSAEDIDRKSIVKAAEYISQSEHEIHSFTIIKNGKLIADYYGQDSTQGNKQRTPADTHELHSTTKSITAMLLGIAIEQQLIRSEHNTVLPYFKEGTISNIDNNKKRLTIAHLLTMQSGLKYTEGMDDALFSTEVSALAFLNRPMLEKPGGRWNYSSGNSQIVAEILRKQSGKTPRQYAEKNLFTPLGIKNLQWYKDPGGTEYGGWGLFLTPRDLARVGYMMLHKGQWQGKQLVPEQWLEKMSTPHIQSAWVDKYGYHLWIKLGGFATTGYKGQNMYILPEHDLVVVFTAELPYQKADAIQEDIIKRFVLPVPARQTTKN